MGIREAELEMKLEGISDQLSEVSNRLAENERQVRSLVEVCAAVADDTLRMCLALDEMRRVGASPPVPWAVATALVDLHHAMQAQQNDLTASNGADVQSQIDHLKSEISRLRREYQQDLESISLGTP